MKSASKLEQKSKGLLIQIEESGGRKNFVKFFTISRAAKAIAPRAGGKLRPNCGNSRLRR